MARHFARLKLRLVRNGLRVGSAQVVGLVLSICLALPLAGLGFLLLAAIPRAEPGFRLPVVVVSFTAIFMGWLLLPLLAFGTDDTLDPARLALLPLSRRQLMSGLLVASTIGVVPLATLVALSGTIVGYAPLGPGAVLVVAAVVVELLLCVTASRTLVTALSGFLRSRRARDISVVVGLTLTLVFNVAMQVGLRVLHTADRNVADKLTEVLRWLPPGLVATAVVDAGDGHVLAGAGKLMLGTAVVAALLAAWSSALGRISTTAESATTSTRKPGLFSGALRLLPRTRTGAVAAKELRYAWRDPRRRAGLISVVPIAFLPLASILFSGEEAKPPTVLAALTAAVILGLQSLNYLGMDGPAYWVNVAAGDDIRADMGGKTVATVLQGTLLSTVVGVVLAAISGGWVYVPLVSALAVGLLLVETGVGNVVSVMAPQPVPEGANPWATGNTGQGCVTGLISLLGMVVALLVCLPVVAAVVAALVLWRPGLAVTGVFAVGYGYLLWRVTVTMAGRRAEGRLPELLESVSPKRAG